MLKQNQKGFGHIGFIIVVLVLVVIGLVGWRVYENQHQHSGPVNNSEQGQSTTSNSGNSGPNYYANLLTDMPSCSGNTVLTSQIADLSAVENITPLGNTSSYNGNAGHVLPVNHLYLNHYGSPTDANGSPREIIPMLAPGNIKIFQVVATDHINSSGVDQLNDNKLYFATCKDVVFWIDHVTALNSLITADLTDKTKQSCQSTVIDGLTYKSCTYNTNIKLTPGTSIGQGGADLGAVDFRIAKQAFIRPSAQQYLYSVCGLNYFAEPYKTELYKKLDNTKLDSDGLPDCGTDMWDKAGTIQGDWFLPNAPPNGSLDTYALVIAPLNTDPSQVNIDWGGTVYAADRIDTTMVSGGTHDTDPSMVTADGHVYCYDDLSHGMAYARSVFVQLADAKTLKIQYYGGACPANPTLTNPTTYIR